MPKAKQEFMANFSLSLSLQKKKIFIPLFLNMHASCRRYLILSCLGGFCAEETSHM